MWNKRAQYNYLIWVKNPMQNGFKLKGISLKGFFWQVSLGKIIYKIFYKDDLT